MYNWHEQMEHAKAAKMRGGVLGKGNARLITDTDRRARDAGQDIALATVAAIWADFRSWSQEGRNRPLGDCAFTYDDIPF